MKEYAPVKEGKVREIYDIGDSLILVATDRISCFDVILDNTVTKKGTVLTQMSRFWFDMTKDIMPNHMISTDVNDMPEFFRQPRFDGNSMLVKKLTMLPVECIVRGYITGIFNSGHLVLAGTGTILVIAFVVRSLPVGTRSGVAALRQIDKSIEESAYDMGADSGKVFTSVTLPLIKDSFLSGQVTTFARSITATSAVIFLISPAFKLITPQIMTVVDRGEYSEACAWATMLMIIVYGSIALMNVLLSFFGTSRRQQRIEKKQLKEGRA